MREDRGASVDLFLERVYQEVIILQVSLAFCMYI